MYEILKNMRFKFHLVVVLCINNRFLLISVINRDYNTVKIQNFYKFRGQVIIIAYNTGV